MIEKLQKDKIVQLIEKSDQKWFINHSSNYKYREYIDFLAEFIASNYNRKRVK